MLNNLSTIEACLIIFFLQMISIYIRTLNIYQIMNFKMLKANITGSLTGLVNLVIMFLGVDALFKNDWLPIIFYIVGGSVGNYLAMSYAKRRVQKRT